MIHQNTRFAIADTCLQISFQRNVCNGSHNLMKKLCMLMKI